MSRGYFADLNITLPAHTWAKIQARKARDIVLVEGWSGLDDEPLERAFGTRLSTDDTFAKVLAWDWGEDALVNAIEGDQVHVRVCVLLDKSQLDLAFPLAVLLEAVRPEGGAGSLRLVNDGTSGGEAPISSVEWMRVLPHVRRNATFGTVGARTATRHRHRERVGMG